MLKQLHTLITATSIVVSGHLFAQSTVNVPHDYSTIQSAINATATGDTILVEAGVYPENLDLQSKGLTIQALDGPETTIISGGGNNTILLLDATPAGTVVDGFTLTGGTGRPSPSSYGFDYYGGGAHASNGAIATIKNCFILRNAVATGTFAGGAYSGGDNTELTLEHCVIAFNHAWASGGATLVDHNAVIKIDRCSIYSNSSNSFFGHQGGVSGANGGDTYIDDSIIWANDGNQIDAFGYPYNIGVDFFVSYSDVEGGYAGSGNINSDPLFVDTNADDFSLSSASPCIDAANPASDLDPDGSRADMGAHPLASTSTFQISGTALQAGGLATLSCANAQPGSRVFFLFSGVGQGSSVVSGITFDILNPRHLVSVDVGTSGVATVLVIVGNGVGKTFWAQALENNSATGLSVLSNVISYSVY